MEKTNKKDSQENNTEETAIRNDSVNKEKKNVDVDCSVEQYRKRFSDNLDRRFLSIFIATLLFNMILVLWMSHIPFEKTADYARKLQEHYANFVYKKKPEPIDVADKGEGKGVVGEEESSDKKEEKESEKEGKPGEEKEKPSGPGTSESASAEKRAKARRAQKTRSTEEIAQEVSKKGLLGLLTGTGDAAQGDAVEDVLGETGGDGSDNLDEVISNVGGIKTSGAPSKAGDNGGVRGGRTSGSGTGIGNMVDDLTKAESENIGSKTDEMVVSESSVHAEEGKSAGRDPESVMSVINSHRAAIEYCYQRALRRNPNLKGKISVRFVISPTGSVKDVKIVSSTLNNRSVERCILSKIRRWRDFGTIDPSKGDAVFRQDYVFGY